MYIIWLSVNGKSKKLFCILKYLFADPVVRDQQARSNISNSSPTLPSGKSCMYF